MLAFEYAKPTDIGAAVTAGSKKGAFYIGGGTNLIDLMKGGIERPDSLVDINHLTLDIVDENVDGGLRIGAAVHNSDLANHPLVRTRYPMLSAALLNGASPQLRNMATVGGNLMQRTRCDYFVDRAFAQCNKRKPGSGCGALHGENRLHAILGASAACVAVHPSDMCVALLALDAKVRVRGTGGERLVPFDEFHRLPGDHPERDTNLARGELILSVELPPSRFAAHCHYLKVRDRASYAFALVSAAVGLDIDAGTIRSARIALGGVAHKPWFAEKASAQLAGLSASSIDPDVFGKLAVEGAKPLAQNEYKIVMAKNAVSFALKRAMDGA
jgi:xanthine dehydrogenase YagS FAD-binding subunit